jgi:FeS assembly protein IscX
MSPNTEASFLSSNPEREDSLSWESTFAIALALMAQHPDINLEEVSLGMIYDWTLGLKGFADDPELANEDILSAIYQEWFEEANPV